LKGYIFLLPYIYIHSYQQISTMDSNLKFPEPVAVSIDESQVSDCVICMEAMDKPVEVCNLECGHSFHIICCNKFFDKLCISNLDITCPLCRAVLQEKTTTEYIINRIDLVRTQMPTRSPARILHENRNRYRDRNMCLERVMICIPLLVLLSFILSIIILLRT
jgi:hypothetical protein